MKKLLYVLLLLSSTFSQSETIIKGIDKDFLDKIKHDGKILKGFINTNDLEFGFVTKSKLWLWNLDQNRLKSIKLSESQYTTPLISDVRYLNDNWIIEGHGQLTILDLGKNKKKTIRHPYVNSGKSIGIEYKNGFYYWAHEDGSLKINADSFDTELFLKPLNKTYEHALLLDKNIYYNNGNNIFSYSGSEIKLIFHSPRKIKTLASSENYLMTMTDNSITQINTRGRIVKVIPNTKPNISKISFQQKSQHCYKLSNKQYINFDTNEEKRFTFSLPTEVNESHFYCYKNLVFLVESSNIVLLADYTKKTNTAKKNKKNIKKKL